MVSRAVSLQSSGTVSAEDQADKKHLPDEGRSFVDDKKEKGVKPYVSVRVYHSKGCVMCRNCDPSRISLLFYV